MALDKIIAAFFLTFFVSSAAGCAGKSAASDEPAEVDLDDTTDWLEYVEESNPWPWFGSTRPVGPSWQLPDSFACKLRQRVRREPDEQVAPGNGARKIVVEDLPPVCFDPGVMVDVTDNEQDQVVVGDCIGGFRLATRQQLIARIGFATPDACEAYEDARAKAFALSPGARSVTRLRLVSREPATLDFVEIRPPTESSHHGAKTVE